MAEYHGAPEAGQLFWVQRSCIEKKSSKSERCKEPVPGQNKMR